MFNWVCPQCGKDVPPSKTDCPFCADRAKEAAAYAAQPPGAPNYAGGPQYAPDPNYGRQPQYQPPPPPQQTWQPPAPVGWQPQPPPPPPAWQPPVVAPAPPPPPPPPPQHAWQPPQQQPPHSQQHPAQAHWPPPPPPRSGPPTWLMGVAFAVAFIGIGAIVIFGVLHFGRTNVAEKAGLENPANASQQKVSNPMQKYVEVVGIRMLSEGKKPVAKFIVVNHSNAEIPDLQANVTLWASTSRSEEDSVGSFSFKLTNLGPGASQELTQPLKTKLKPYELPDWQNATAEVQVTSPTP